MDGRTALHGCGKPANSATVHGDQVIVHTSFQVRNDRRRIAAGTTLVLGPSGIVPDSIPNEWHGVIQETGSDNLANLAWCAGRSVLPQDFQNTSGANDVHATLKAFLSHADPFALAVMIKALALKKLLDTGSHPGQQRVTARNDRA